MIKKETIVLGARATDSHEGALTLKLHDPNHERAGDPLAPISASSGSGKAPHPIYPTTSLDISSPVPGDFTNLPSPLGRWDKTATCGDNGYRSFIPSEPQLGMCAPSGAPAKRLLLRRRFHLRQSAGILWPCTGKTFARQGGGIGPDIRPTIRVSSGESETDSALEVLCLRQGDADRRHHEIRRGGGGGGPPPQPEQGRKFCADLYIDSSGSRCELLGKFLEEPLHQPPTARSSATGRRPSGNGNAPMRRSCP